MRPNGPAISRKRREPKLSIEQNLGAPIGGCIALLCRWSHRCCVDLDSSYFQAGAANVPDCCTNRLLKGNCLAMKIYRKDALARAGCRVVTSGGVQGIRHAFRQLHAI